MRVRQRIPWFDGAKLDDITDYLTYVFVPALFVWRGALVPNAWVLPVVAAMLLSSAYGFNRTDAKTSDHFFTGFPSYWNVVTFYLLVARWPSAVNAAILVVFAALVFVPIRYVYPSRTPAYGVVTNLAGAVWAALMLVMLWQYPAVSETAFWVSLAYPLYYFVLSFRLHFKASA
jgi:phosphatidylcholine synthase